MPNLKDLYTAAKADPSYEEEGSFERWDPPVGFKATVEVTQANAGRTQSNEATSFGFFVEVLDGEYQGKKFWTNIYINDDGRNAHIGFKKLDALGVGSVLEQTGDPDDVANAAVGKRVELVAKKGGKKPDGTHYINHYFNSTQQKGQVDLSKGTKPKGKGLL